MSVPAVSSEMNVGAVSDLTIGQLPRNTSCSSLDVMALPLHLSNLVSSFEAIIIVHIFAPNFTLSLGRQ